MMDPCIPDGDSRPESNAAVNAFFSWLREQAMSHLLSLKQGMCPRAHLTFVLGSEAGDLDSVACAIALSYLVNKHRGYFSDAYGLETWRTLYVPVIQTPRSMLQQRCENMLVYTSVGFNPDSVLCIDDLEAIVELSSSSMLGPNACVSFGLVDHGALSMSWGASRHGTDTGLWRRVDLIVDHHEDAGHHPEARMRIIYPPSLDPVGSASSLVSHMYQSVYTKTSEVDLPELIADLLMSALMLDTKNGRRVPAGLATDIDLTALTFVQPRSSFRDRARATEFYACATAKSSIPTPPMDLSLPERLQFTSPWTTLLTAVRGNVAHLTPYELLARDFKGVEVNRRDGTPTINVGFSSMPISLSAWLSCSYRRAEATTVTAETVISQWRTAWDVLDAWMLEKRLHILLLLCSFREPRRENGSPGPSRREILIVQVGEDCGLIARVCAALEEEAPRGNATLLLPSLVLSQWTGERSVADKGGPEEIMGVDQCGRAICRRPGARVLWLIGYKQGNTKASRKVLLPIIVRVLQSRSSLFDFAWKEPDEDETEEAEEEEEEYEEGDEELEGEEEYDDETDEDEFLMALELDADERYLREALV
ncbi:exopolyphosphatase [Malassezia sp. CBS 17886]|nr:exopolyphosphatase [Malassezia sp. CBS 17886]